MALVIDGVAQDIFVPKADLLFIGFDPVSGREIRQHDTDAFHRELRGWEGETDQGRVSERTHNYNAPTDLDGTVYAAIIKILSYSVTYEDGTYQVRLVGSNNNIASKATVNSVQVIPNNSAGLTYSKQIEDSAYTDSRVWIDVDTGSAGSAYPRGTSGDPVNNLADAQAIVTGRGLPKRLHVTGDLVIGASDDISDYNILGESVKLSKVTVATGAITTNLVIQDCELTGDLNGNVTARRATSFQNLQDFDGTLHGTGLGGTITLEMGTNAHEFIDCYSQEGGIATPTVDCQNIVDPEIYFRRYSGGLLVQNFSSGSMTIGVTDGRVVLDSTCTGGTIKIYGVIELVNNSGPGCTVVTSGAVNEIVSASGGLTSEQAAQLAILDSLQFTVPNYLDVNVSYMNDAEVIGTGVDGDPFRGVGEPP